MRLLFLALLFLTACSQNVPILPLSPCIPTVKPKPPPCNKCPALPVDNQSVSLGELVDLTLYNSPLTKQSWSQARAAAAGVTIAESSYYPSVTGTIDVNRERFPAVAQAFSGITYSSFDAAVYLNYLLWDFGGRENTAAAACATLYAASWSYNWQIQTVMINTIQSYWASINARSQLVAREADLHDAKTVLDLSEAKKKAGLATHVDVAQAAANYTKAKLNVVSAQGNLSNSLAQTAVNIGLDPTYKMVLAEPAPIETLKLRHDVEYLVARAKCCRADLASLRAAIKAQYHTLLATESQNYPSISFSGYVEKTWYLKIGNSPGLTYVTDLSLSYPIFTGFYIQGNIQQNLASLEAQLYSYDQSQLEAKLDVVTNYNSVLTALESYDYSVKYLEYARDSFDSNLTGYKKGTKDIVDVINAEATLSDARSSLISSETQVHTSMANLAYTGGVLVSQEVTP